MTYLLMLIIASIFTQNIALTYLLGMCPFVALSRSLKTSVGMSFAVIFVVTLTTVINYPIYHFILKPLNSTLIYFIVFIIVIAASVQLVEMIVERFSPPLYFALGIFLPLITVNCAILGVSLFMIAKEGYGFVESTVFGFGSGLGWMLAIVSMSAIRQKLRYANVPTGLEGFGITMIATGLMAMAFMLFSGITL